MAIVELGTELVARLRDEPLARERLRLVRETTNRITRVANDAIQAYRRATRAVDARAARHDADPSAAEATRQRLRSARTELLRVLELAGRRYPLADD